MKIKGYKAFREDMTCDPDPKNPFRYEVGKIYEMPDHPILCVRGFHFCGNVSDCYNYYPTTDRTPICEVEADGWLEFSDEARRTNGRYGKMVTNRITILRRLTNEEVIAAVRAEAAATLPESETLRQELEYLAALLSPVPEPAPLTDNQPAWAKETIKKNDALQEKQKEKKMKKIVLYLIKMAKPENPGERWPDMELRMDVSVDGRNCTETFQRLVTTRMDTPWWSFETFLDRGAGKFREALFQLGIVLNKREVRKWLSSFESDDKPDIYTHKDVRVSIAREGGA